MLLSTIEVDQKEYHQVNLKTSVPAQFIPDFAPGYQLDFLLLENLLAAFAGEEIEISLAPCSAPVGMINGDGLHFFVVICGVDERCITIPCPVRLLRLYTAFTLNIPGQSTHPKFPCNPHTPLFSK